MLSPDVLQGTGTQVWKDSGSMYNGEWKHGKCDGFGTFSVLLPDAKEYATKYCGEWLNGKKHVRLLNGLHTLTHVCTLGLMLQPLICL